MSHTPAPGPSVPLSPGRHAVTHPAGSWLNRGRVGMALSLVPFAAIALGAALGLP
jgi:hypothetical protein